MAGRKAVSLTGLAKAAATAQSSEKRVRKPVRGQPDYQATFFAFGS